LVGLAGAQAPSQLIEAMARSLALASRAGHRFRGRASAVARCGKSGYSRFMSSLARALAPVAPIAVLGGLLLLRPARR
jgi:hypothetical protein